MTTELKATISHSDTDITPVFARKVDSIFGGHVTILPNADVLNSARRQSRRHDVELSVVADRGFEATSGNCYTVYRIGTDVLLIDACDSSTTDLGDMIMDDDEREEFVADHPELSDLIAAMYEAWSN